MNARLFVEGGGDQRSTLAACRRGFSELARKMVPPGAMPRVTACGGRQSAYDDFAHAHGEGREHCLLLVDSEGPVNAEDGAWQHLARRDGWTQPDAVADDQAHLMVQCMEAWLLADRACLATYYGQGFKRSSLPANPAVEEISKSDLAKRLTLATRGTKTKGAYHKTRHGFDLLSLVDAHKVETAAPWAGRFFEALRTLSGG